MLDISYSDSGVLRGFIEPFNLEVDADGNPVYSGSGSNVSGNQVGVNPVLRTDPLQKDGSLQAFGLNVNYAIDDTWSVEVDLASSESEKRDLRAESYSGLARSGTLGSDELGSRAFQMSDNGIFFNGQTGLEAFGDANALQLTGPQEWGGGMANIADQFTSTVLQENGQPYSFLNAQDGFMNYADFGEELTTAKFELQGTLDGDLFTGVVAGLQISDRFKEKVNKGLFATAASYPFSTGIPSEYVYGLADLSWAGLGQVVAYDGFAPYYDETYTLNDAGLLEPDRLGDTFTVDERVTTFYVKADFETDLGDMPVFGNVGLQYIRSDQSSSGYIGVVGDNFAVCDDNSDGVVDESCKITAGDKYTHLLPSFNLSAEVADNQFVRVAASKTISRARIDQMRASGFVKFNQNIDLIATPNTLEAVEANGSPWSKVTGNPMLRPLEANNFDVSYENYFDDEGYVSVAVFYKDLVNWTRDGNQYIDFTNDPTNGGADYFIPGFHDRIVSQDGVFGPDNIAYSQGDLITPPDFGAYSFFEDGLKGEVKGLEVTANIPLNMLADQLDGFGVAASMTLIDAKLDNGASIPGQSDSVYSLTAYYAMDGFEVRVAATDRDGFTTYERGGSNKIAEASRDGVSLIDAQISYDFSEAGVESLKGLKLSLQGTNLTDEDESTRDGNGIITVNRQFGPSYLLNVNYSFY